MKFHFQLPMFTVKWPNGHMCRGVARVLRPGLEAGDIGQVLLRPATIWCCCACVAVAFEHHWPRDGAPSASGVWCQRIGAFPGHSPLANLRAINPRKKIEHTFCVYEPPSGSA